MASWAATAIVASGLPSSCAALAASRMIDAWRSLRSFASRRPAICSRWVAIARVTRPMKNAISAAASANASHIACRWRSKPCSWCIIWWFGATANSSANPPSDSAAIADVHHTLSTIADSVMCTR